jgi:hypothetical protein
MRKGRASEAPSHLKNEWNICTPSKEIHENPGPFKRVVDYNVKVRVKSGGNGIDRRHIVAMQMPATPDQHRFYSALLFELGALHSTSAGLSTLERLARDLLRRVAPRILIVDEVHHLLAGSYRE